MQEKEEKCGFIALLGLPNAGKSTLLNACIGKKIAAVSRKPQTTRNRILGLANFARCQFIYLDTPGMHSGYTHQLNKVMTKVITAAAEDADVLNFLIDLGSHSLAAQEQYLRDFISQAAGRPFFILGTKVDAYKRAVVEKASLGIENLVASMVSANDNYRGFFPISAKRKETLVPWQEALAAVLPVGPHLYEAGQVSDRSSEFLVTEIIREQVFRLFSQELPYGNAVQVEQIEEVAGKLELKVLLIVNKASHKPMLLGKNGCKIKELRLACLKNLEGLFERKVILHLHVKVQRDWTERYSSVIAFQDFQLQSSK